MQRRTVKVWLVTLGLVAALALAACSSDDLVAGELRAEGSAERSAETEESVVPTATPVPVDPDYEAITPAAGEARVFPPAPEVVDGPLDPALVAEIDGIFGLAPSGGDLVDVIGQIGESGDVRLGWLLADFLRFVSAGSSLHQPIVDAFENVTGHPIEGVSVWNGATNTMIAWDPPAPSEYRRWKGALFESTEPAWRDFFADEDAAIDWRHLSWGGVLIDGRPLDAVDLPCPRGCIPALDDPVVTDAAGGDWYPDDAVVFGVTVNGESRAYPKNVMEVQEMVNDTVGGRRIGMPYCTLCGSAQAYFTDDVAKAIEADLDLGGTDSFELRTSGLLTRSNKVMYEFHTRSVFDTFTGEALSGPLQDLDVVLEQVTVVTATWGDWKAAHPDTTITSENRPWGGTYPENPLRGRDDNGPIFPIGDVDARLTVQESILGVLLADGTAIAFPAEAAGAALAAGRPVEHSGVSLVSDAGGLRAQFDGEAVASHQAFWFAWSQFHPETALWSPEMN